MTEDTTSANHIRDTGEWTFQGEVLRRLTALEKSITAFLADRSGAATELALLTQRVVALEKENEARAEARKLADQHSSDERQSFKMQLRLLVISAVGSPIATIIVAAIWTHKG